MADDRDADAEIDAILEAQRADVVAACTDLSAAEASARLVPSSTTVAGLVKHLTAVERSWFQHRVDGVSRAAIDGVSDGTDPESWAVRPDESLPVLIERYDATCAISRMIARRHRWDRVIDHPALGPITVRWIVLHMIEETARHAGHLDILCEQLLARREP